MHIISLSALIHSFFLTGTASSSDTIPSNYMGPAVVAAVVSGVFGIGFLVINHINQKALENNQRKYEHLKNRFTIISELLKEWANSNNSKSILEGKDLVRFFIMQINDIKTRYKLVKPFLDEEYYFDEQIKDVDGKVLDIAIWVAFWDSHKKQMQKL